MKNSSITEKPSAEQLEAELNGSNTAPGTVRC